MERKNFRADASLLHSSLSSIFQHLLQLFAAGCLQQNDVVRSDLFLQPPRGGGVIRAPDDLSAKGAGRFGPFGDPFAQTSHDDQPRPIALCDFEAERDMLVPFRLAQLAHPAEHEPSTAFRGY